MTLTLTAFNVTVIGLKTIASTHNSVIQFNTSLTLRKHTHYTGISNTMPQAHKAGHLLQGRLAVNHQWRENGDRSHGFRNKLQTNARTTPEISPSSAIKRKCFAVIQQQSVRRQISRCTFMNGFIVSWTCCQTLETVKAVAVSTCRRKLWVEASCHRDTLNHSRHLRQRHVTFDSIEWRNLTIKRGKCDIILPLNTSSPVKTTTLNYTIFVQCRMWDA